MHHAYWGLKRPPFVRQNCQESSFHEGGPQTEGLARLRHMVQQSRRAALVTGGRGCGKTLLLNRFANECRDQGLIVACVELDGATALETLAQISSQLALNPRPDDDAVRLMRRLADWAASNFGQHQNATTYRRAQSEAVRLP
jgi:type II secretory pathway predicted ATPase ExeA